MLTLRNKTNAAAHARSLKVYLHYYCGTEVLGPKDEQLKRSPHYKNTVDVFVSVQTSFNL